MLSCGRWPRWRIMFAGSSFGQIPLLLGVDPARDQDPEPVGGLGAALEQEPQGGPKRGGIPAARALQRRACPACTMLTLP